MAPFLPGEFPAKQFSLNPFPGGSIPAMNKPSAVCSSFIVGRTTCNSVCVHRPYISLVPVA